MIEPATPDRWDAVLAVLGRRSAKPDACWCQRFRRRGATDHGALDNETALRRELDTADVPIGLLAYVDGEPAGWSRVVPRRRLPGVGENRALQRLLPADPGGLAWWVACVVVRPEHRGAGVGAALLRAAADHAREHGASVLDGHPVDVARLSARPSPSALFTGTVSMFEAAGFVELGRTYPSRPVMRLAFE